MSAFLVSNETINQAIAGLQYADMVDQAVQDCDVDACTELGQRLADLNAEAVAYRYDRPTEPRAFRYVCRRSNMPRRADLCSALKALYCLRYQCNEGDVPESELYEGLGDAANTLAYEIVTELADYRLAPWDSPEPGADQAAQA